ncbi:hypothetical protein T03_6386 [Trichinella britovi]|uniref:Uncharacterized protein n=1 Tax=Trichinella britovi TaxID=45882 RepID=A0A0V0YXM1_TRIBR|nr:hypothetical protein T03_6386 [Trichinella britovi]
MRGITFSFLIVFICILSLCFQSSVCVDLVGFRPEFDYFLPTPPPGFIWFFLF